MEFGTHFVEESCISLLVQEVRVSFTLVTAEDHLFVIVSVRQMVTFMLVWAEASVRVTLFWYDATPLKEDVTGDESNEVPVEERTLPVIT